MRDLDAGSSLDDGVQQKEDNRSPMSRHRTEKAETDEEGYTVGLLLELGGDGRQEEGDSCGEIRSLVEIDPLESNQRADCIYE